MREIKFRVWSNDLKKYRFLSDVNDSQGLGMGFEVTKGWGGNITTLYHSIGDVVEQFTGLKDRNGKDIYEGDIIKTEKGNLQEVVSLIGKFNNKNMTSQFTCFYVGWENMNPSDVIGYYFSDTDEVVGNIHNNPDLLEVSK